MNLKVGNVFIEQGQKAESYLSFGKRADGTDLGIPLMGVLGHQPGPIVGMVTGVHGDEYEGPEAVRAIMAKIDPAKLKGGIICTPQANITAFEVFDRTGWVDRLDMNRSFPGREDGYLTQRVANAVVKEIVEQCDYLLDMHSAGLTIDLAPYVGYNDTDSDVGRASFELAKAFGVPLLYSSTPFPNVLRLEAHKRNIPGILIEVGGEGRFRQDKFEEMERGLWNVLRYLKMVDGEPTQLPKRYSIVKAPPEGEFIHSPSGGFLRSYVAVGDKVSAGQVLGDIIDVFGNLIVQIASPMDGIILLSRTIPSIRVGDWSFAVVEVTGTVE
jgi:predicted deacylase